MKKLKLTIGFILKHPLGKKHPVRALANFVQWQLQCILFPDKLLVKPFIKPLRFYARSGLTGITGNIYTGLHEFNDMAFLLHFLRTDDLFVDVGANVGSYSLLAAGVTRSAVYAVEPGASAFELLYKNIQLNNLQQRVTAVNAVAGPATGEALFTTGQDTTNHVVSPQEKTAGNVVPMITIDALLSGRSASLIKIDVEGYETEVMNGMADTLTHTDLKAIIIELNGSGGRYGYNEEAIHQQLVAHNFAPYNYNPFTRTLNRQETFGTFNTIYCRDVRFIEARLRNAARFTVLNHNI
jgi:FkbM family methyltransferase